jgi:hypothetical protein
MADKEIARKHGSMNAVDYLCQQLGKIDITLPQNLDSSHVVIDRAMDVQSACMLFLSSQIRRENMRLGTVGNVS